jgi:hypothetical protein
MCEILVIANIARSCRAVRVLCLQLSQMHCEAPPLSPPCPDCSHSHAPILYLQYVLAWTAIGRLYTRTGRPDMARKAYEQARISDPEFAPTWEGAPYA